MNENSDQLQQWILQSYPYGKYYPVFLRSFLYGKLHSTIKQFFSKFRLNSKIIQKCDIDYLISDLSIHYLLIERKYQKNKQSNSPYCQHSYIFKSLKRMSNKRLRQRFGSQIVWWDNPVDKSYQLNKEKVSKNKKPVVQYFQYEDFCRILEKYDQKQWLKSQNDKLDCEIDFTGLSNVECALLEMKLQNKSYEEIARNLEITTNNVYQIFNRVKKKIKNNNHLR